MKLVLLYGLPALGKLSVAGALAAKTGFRVLHNNHLLIDLAEAVSGVRTPGTATVLRHLRNVGLHAARAAQLQASS